MSYDKPFKTYDEQIDILINKYNLNIPNTDYAATALETLNYYDLVNGYKDVLMYTDKEKFFTNITINDLVQFRLMDLDFQNILFQLSFHVENRFKSIVSYYV